MNKKTLNVLSFGAGKQSTYMLIKGLEGAYGEKPDYAVFCDLENEPRYVYEHLKRIQKYVNRRFNFEITVLKVGSITSQTLAHFNGHANWSPTPPFWFKGEGFFRRQCTNHLKIRPVRKFLQTVRSGRKVKLWLGISLDESERAKISQLKYIENFYPLIENRISLSEIKNAFPIDEIGEPGKSSCIICPFHTDNYWQRLKKLEPDSFEFACIFDQVIRQAPFFKHKLYLHRSGIPLSKINFTQRPTLFPELFEECEGLCGI